MLNISVPVSLTPFFFSSDIICGGFQYQVCQNHSVFFYHEDSDEMYVGGTDFVLKFDVDDHTHNHVIEVGDHNFDYFITFHCHTPDIPACCLYSFSINGCAPNPVFVWLNSVLQLGS